MTFRLQFTWLTAFFSSNPIPLSSYLLWDETLRLRSAASKETFDELKWRAPWWKVINREDGISDREADLSATLPDTSVTWIALQANLLSQNLHNKLLLTDSLMRRPWPVIYMAGFRLNILWPVNTCIPTHGHHNEQTLEWRVFDTWKHLHNRWHSFAGCKNRTSRKRHCSKPFRMDVLLYLYTIQLNAWPSASLTTITDTNFMINMD